MRLPKGQLWQTLFARALDLVPADTRDAQSDWNLVAWRESGEPRVIGQSGKALLFQASPYTFGSALLNEVQSLLDHAGEHRAVVQKIAASQSDCSPSWLFVSTYYWGFFSALALIRLCGHATWFLDRKALAKLVAGSEIKAPGAGTFVLRVGDVRGTTIRDFQLISTPDRYHEAVWNLLSTLIYPEVKRVKAIVGSTDASQICELELFSCIAHDAFAPPNWPSTLRNAINYRPGFSYTAVHGVDPLRIGSFLRKFRITDFVSLSNQYSNLSSGLPAKCDLTKHLEVASKILSLKAVFLDELANAIMAAVINERRMDGRWTIKRINFLKKHLPVDGYIWPFANT